MARQLDLLAEAPFPADSHPVRELPGGLRLTERRVPVGVIGANFEARPNVTIDIASQLLKSRNAGVLRTGGAALRSATALADEVIAPALAAAGLDPGTVQLVRSADREAAVELVRQPELIPLVILRGSGETTRNLAAAAAAAGCARWPMPTAAACSTWTGRPTPRWPPSWSAASLDRLGVCNRLNLLLICAGVWDAAAARRAGRGPRPGVTPPLPPHAHPLGPRVGPGHRARGHRDHRPGGRPGGGREIANACTSGLAASIVTTEPAAAAEFLAAYRGTGAFWNASTRLLDGFKLRGVPETGINVDHVPGPRGPVTFHDLCLRQYVVTPA